MRIKNSLSEIVDDINKNSNSAIAYIPKNSPQKDNLMSFFKNVVNIFKNNQEQIDEESKKSNKNKNKDKDKSEIPSLNDLTPDTKEPENNFTEKPEQENPGPETDLSTQSTGEQGQQNVDDKKNKSNEPEHFIGPGERKISTQPEYGQAKGKGTLHLEYSIGKDENGSLKAAIIVRELERNKEDKTADAKYLAHAVFSIENEEQFIEDLKHNRWQISRILKTSFGI